MEKFQRLLDLLELDGLIKCQNNMVLVLTDNLEDRKEIESGLRIFLPQDNSIWSRLFNKKKYGLKCVTDSISAQITPLGLKYLNEMTSRIEEKPNTVNVRNNHIFLFSKGLIKDGRLRLAIETLFKLDLKNEYKNILYYLLGRLSLVETEERKGTISFEQKTISKNKVMDELLGIINIIEKQY